MKITSLRLMCALFILMPVLTHAQWIKLTFPTTENLWKVRFADANTGWVAGQKFIYRTTNGGTLWSPQDSTKGSVFAMEAVNVQTALYSGYGLGIRRTTNGGQSWSVVDTNRHYNDDMTFISASVGYVCGGAAPTMAVPIVRKTTDGGATWFTAAQSFPKAKAELTGISFINDLTGWTVTYDGFVYQTVNGGTDWTLLDSLGAKSYRDICFYDANYGWIVGGISGTQKMEYATNGGTTWNHVSGGGSSPREVEIVDQTHSWYGGSNNAAPYIYRLDSIGGAWKSQELPPGSAGVESIDMVSTTTGYSVGAGGSVYKTTNGGVLAVGTGSDNSQPFTFSLQQNYPNPFNPSTTIEYDVAAAGNVRITVYDILGRSMGILVNEVKGPGHFTATFNARSLSSGLYFYLMRAGNFVSVKRMVLVK